jgi:sterol desaturase/sphingolipid hydroxylase (fatty acid hydroxylase superfamily)
MDAVEFFSLLVPVTWLVLFVLERIFPARTFPPIRGWAWIGAGALLLIGVVQTVVPLLIPADWLAAHRVFDGTRLGVAGGTVVGGLLATLAFALLHRAFHRVPLLWRLFHQIHHSPQRVDIAGSAVFHVTEMALYALVSVALLTLVLGLDPVAAAAVGYYQAFLGIFEHANIRTPQWLGYVVQRPESHCVHHRRGMHTFNFSDFPLWDILLGSFRNPREFRGEVGFDAPADGRVGAMLLFRDVNAPLYGPDSRGISPANAAGLRAGAPFSPSVVEH